ncbi:2989_t:CDS:2 [Acaulospora morrowiae]|uniref:2989_t:CDS:1 n=1 Tax=Acaulospora morrowiae TaxID=94023 RepID=A0A9N9BNB7_9GLOM|nr:2989_t:CDS:2 [Acaulospora morrowiae]
MKSKVDNSSYSDLKEKERKKRKLTNVNDDCGFFNFGVQGETIKSGE